VVPFDFHQSFGKWSLDGLTPLRCVLVEQSRPTGRMDYEHPFLSRRFDHPVHGWRHLCNSIGSTLTCVIIPHIADNDRCLLRIPMNRSAYLFEICIVLALLNPAAHLQRQVLCLLLVGHGISFLHISSRAI
jgi:hypothetical protein